MALPRSGSVQQTMESAAGIATGKAGASAAMPVQAAKPSGKRAHPAFMDWTQRYLDAAEADRAGLVAEGVALAAERRPEFKRLIQTNPRQALLDAVPMVVRQDLPEAVVALLEERVNGRGAIRVYQGVGTDNASPAQGHRVVELASGQTYAACVYGRREESVLWVANASVNGVAMEVDLAVNEHAYRSLEVGERPDPAKPAVAVCPVSGKTSAAEEQIGEAITEATPADG